MKTKNQFTKTFLWSEGRQIMIKLIFEKIDFSISQKDHRYLLKWNCVIFLHNNFSMFIYKSIKDI